MNSSAVYYDSLQIQAAASKAIAAADRVRLCLTNAPLLKEGPLWVSLVANVNKVEMILLGKGCVGPGALDTFKPLGILRAAEPEVSADVLMVNTGTRTQVFVGVGLGGEHRRSTSVSHVDVDGEDEAACSAEQLFERCRQRSALATNLPAPTAIVGHIPSPPHENIEGSAHELHRNDAFSDDGGYGGYVADSERLDTDFLDQETDDQIDQVWEALIGHGPKERDEAIRIAANWLKEKGQAQFHRLRKNESDLYLRIDEVLKAGKKRNRFDLPKPGHYRARVEWPTEIMWRSSLLQCLPKGPVDREDAIRMTAEFAADRFGFPYERLRRDGRVWEAVKSAIRSCMRRKLIARVGNEIELAKGSAHEIPSE